MSVMICSRETFERTVKVLNAYCCERFGEIYNLDIIKVWFRDIATLNCQSYAERYNEDVRIEFDDIEIVPSERLKAQDIMSARCWLYQIEGDCLDDHTYKMVDKAVDWAMDKYRYTEDNYNACEWG